MRKTALLLLRVLELISISCQFRCQDTTLVTARAPNSLGAADGMLCYVPRGRDGKTIRNSFRT